MPLRAHLVIFARLPRFGAGKRRLAAGVGPVRALRFQRVTLALTLLRHGADPRWTTWLAVTPDRSGPWPPGFGVLPQGKGDLGERMARVAKLIPAPSARWAITTRFLARRRMADIGRWGCAAVRASRIPSVTCAGRPNMRWPTAWRIWPEHPLRCSTLWTTSTTPNPFDAILLAVPSFGPSPLTEPLSR